MLYFDCFLVFTRKKLQTFVEVLYFLLSFMVTIGTCIFTTVPQNNLKVISTYKVLISSTIALQLLRVSMRHNTESKNWVEDYHNVFSNVRLSVL